MAQKRYDKNCFECTQKIYTFIAAQYPDMIAEGFTLKVIQKILGLYSRISMDEDADLEIEKHEDRKEDRFFSSNAAKAPRIRTALAEKSPLAPLTRLGIYYVLGIDEDICSEEAGLWLSHETHGETIAVDYGDDWDRCSRYSRLDVLESTTLRVMDNKHAFTQIICLKECMKIINEGQYSKAQFVLKYICAELLTEQGKHPIHIETLQYCAELFLDCGEPGLALKCFLRFAYRIRANEDCIHKLYLGIYQIIKDGVEVELDSSLIARLIAGISKMQDKNRTRRSESLYEKLRSRVPVFSQKYRQVRTNVGL